MRNLATAALLAAAMATPAFAQQQIGAGETRVGALAAGDQRDSDNTFIDVFSFRGEAGKTYRVNLRSAAFDAWLQIRQPGSNTLTNDDGPNMGHDSEILFTPPRTGNYDIVVGTLQNAQGQYSLSVSDGVAAAPANVGAARRIQAGETLRGQLSASSPKHDDDTPYEAYVFSGQAGQTVTIDMTSSAFDSYLVLRRAGQGQDLAKDDDGGGGQQARLTFTLPSSGDYEIRANSISKSSSGPFSLSLNTGGAARPAPPPNQQVRATDIAYGRIVRGELSTSDPQAGDDSYFDLYRFQGRRGDRVRITLNSSAFDAYLSLYSVGNSDSIASDDDGAGGTDAQISFTLPADGAYEVRANTLSDGETGAYVLGLSKD